MQGGRDPFGGPFGGFGNHRNVVSNIFGGRDPFDDPFFTSPFGGMMGPSFPGHNGSPFGGMMGPSLFGQNGSPFGGMMVPSLFGQNGSPFESTIFGPGGSPFGPSPFMGTETPGFLEHQPSHRPRSTGPIIEELNSDEEGGDKEENPDANEKKANPRKHRRSTNEPFVEDPDDEAGERSNQLQTRNDFNRVSGSSSSLQSQPQAHNFTFQSSTVTYGGASGPLYTSSTTRRSGSDGLTFEEHKEANAATRQAAHRISKGIHKKGHSVTRKLNSDGRVHTTQTLHNVNEDELAGFEETWKGNAAKQLPGWSGAMNVHGDIGSGSSAQHLPNRGGWALPSTGGSNQYAVMSPGSRDVEGHPHNAARTNNSVGERKGSASGF